MAAATRLKPSFMAVPRQRERTAVVTRVAGTRWSPRSSASTEDEETGIITTTGRPVEATDARVSGSSTVVDDYGMAAPGAEEDSGIDVSSTTAVPENEGGSWVGTGRGVGAATPESDRFGSEFWELQGRGGYEGPVLFVVLNGDGQRWGIVMPAEEVRGRPMLPTE